MTGVRLEGRSVMVLEIHGAMLVSHAVAADLLGLDESTSKI